MSRQRIPNNIKVLHGERRPSRLNIHETQIQPVTETPKPPAWLSRDAKTYWRRVVPILERNQILTDADIESLAVMCSLYAKVKQQFVNNEDVQAATITQLRLFQMQFGLTPVSRTNIKGTGPKKKNPFAED